MIQRFTKQALASAGPLVGQFDRHYRRKEELMFPIMGAMGMISKVSVGVDAPDLRTLCESFGRSQRPA